MNNRNWYFGETQSILTSWAYHFVRQSSAHRTCIIALCVALGRASPDYIFCRDRINTQLLQVDLIEYYAPGDLSFTLSHSLTHYIILSFFHWLYFSLYLARALFQAHSLSFAEAKFLVLSLAKPLFTVQDSAITHTEQCEFVSQASDFAMVKMVYRRPFLQRISSFCTYIKIPTSSSW